MKQNDACRRIVVRTLAMALCAACVPVFGMDTNPPQGVFGDVWLSVFLDGQKIGYAHITMTRDKDQIITENMTSMQFKRGASPIEILARETTTETLDGKPLSFDQQVTFANQPVRTSGKIIDGKVEATLEQYGFSRSLTADYPSGASMSWGMVLKQSKVELAPGTVIEMSAYIPSQSLNEAIPMKYEILEKESVGVTGGAKIEAYKARVTMTLKGVDIVSESWLDSNWEPVKATMQMMGLEFVMMRCTREEALRDIGGAELFYNSLIPISRSINRSAHSVTYKFTAREGKSLPSFPETAMQKIVERSPDGRSIQLKVSRLDAPKIPSRQETESSANLAEYLEASLIIASDDPEVIKMASNAAGDETEAHALASNLCQYVNKTIEHVDLGTGFATAAEVCREKKGDCTEHAVLLAALGRARGIPSRVVTGLIYVSSVGGHKNVLGFHMWTQFWIGGTWVDMDAAWGQTQADPTHIAMGTHSAKDVSMGNLVSSAMFDSGNYTIEVVHIDYGKQATDSPAE